MIYKVTVVLLYLLVLAIFLAGAGLAVKLAVAGQPHLAVALAIMALCYGGAIIYLARTKG